MSPAQDHPDGVDDAGNITAQRQENIQPEMQAESDLKKHTDGRENDGDQNTNDVHGDRLSSCLRPAGERVVDGLVSSDRLLRRLTGVGFNFRKPQKPGR